MMQADLSRATQRAKEAELALSHARNEADEATEKLESMGGIEWTKQIHSSFFPSTSLGYFVPLHPPIPNTSALQHTQSMEQHSVC